MAISKFKDTDGQGASSVEQGITEALLRTEIGFWRDMIVACRDTEPPDSIERMQYALALAELRLGHSCENQPSNVFHIDTARGDVK
jgi:hypothetical protein